MRTTFNRQKWEEIGKKAGWLKQSDDQEETGGTEEQEDSLSVAKTILEQLGGRRFSVMTGARGFAGGENYLSFRIPGKGFARSGINYVKISLNSMDLYDMEFGRIRGDQYKVMNTVSGVYFDQLQSVFKSETGLDTHL